VHLAFGHIRTRPAADFTGHQRSFVVTAPAPSRSAPKAAAKASAKPSAKAAARPPVKKAEVPAPKPAKAPVSAKPSPAKPVPAKSAPVKSAAPKPTPAPAPLKAGVSVQMPTVNKRATQAAMQAQMNEAVTPSHRADAAKATFSPTQVHSPMFTPVQVPPRKDPKLANNWKKKPLESLTDEDVLSMPDDAYMNDVQLAFFRRKLQQLKHDILVNAGETTEHLREDTVVVPDPADRATIEEEHALELRTRDRERKLLKKIEQSIARIDNGDYGYCDETGEPIGVGRLLARPTASLSIEAQQRRELKQKLFGD
jgi:DnaK suppressor protein